MAAAVTQRPRRAGAGRGRRRAPWGCGSGWRSSSSSPCRSALRPGRTDSPLAPSHPLRPGRRRRRRRGAARQRKEQVSAAGGAEGGGGEGREGRDGGPGPGAPFSPSRPGPGERGRRSSGAPGLPSCAAGKGRAPARAGSPAGCEAGGRPGGSPRRGARPAGEGLAVPAIQPFLGGAVPSVGGRAGACLTDTGSSLFVGFFSTSVGSLLPLSGSKRVSALCA